MTGRLENKVALITGTAAGQGRAAALLFAREGAVVIGCDLNAAANEQTVRLVTEAGGRMVGMGPVDLGDPVQAEAWVQEAAAVEGRIDVVYNNAGAGRHDFIENLTAEDWRFTMRNEVDIPFYVTRFAWPFLKRNGGVIISTASIAGHKGLPGLIPHCTGKGAILAMSRAFAAEGAEYGIRAVTISPGPIELPESPTTAEYGVASADATALKRRGTVDEIANAALYLASDEASFMTACDLLIDGGKAGVAHQAVPPPGEGPRYLTPPVTA
jgi:NAD(P)-dependent dehydrogenase (short-subunit alcohol dehydrogenase family)